MSPTAVASVGEGCFWYLLLRLHPLPWQVWATNEMLGWTNQGILNDPNTAEATPPRDTQATRPTPGVRTTLRPKRATRELRESRATQLHQRDTHVWTRATETLYMGRYNRPQGLLGGGIARPGDPDNPSIPPPTEATALQPPTDAPTGLAERRTRGGGILNLYPFSQDTENTEWGWHQHGKDACAFIQAHLATRWLQGLPWPDLRSNRAMWEIYDVGCRLTASYHLLVDGYPPNRRRPSQAC